MNLHPAPDPSINTSVANPQQLHLIIEQAIAYLRGEHADACIAACETALRLQPECPEALLLLGLTSLQLGEPANAATLVAKAYQARQDIREFAQALAITNAHLGNINDGLFYTKLATTLPPHPEFPDILPPPFDNFLANVEEAKPGLYRARADRLLTEGRYGGSIDAATKQLAITPGDQDTLRLLAAACRKGGAVARAIATGRALVHGHDRQQVDFVTLAEALSAGGQFTAAETLLDSPPNLDSASAMSARAVNAVSDPESSMANIRAIHQAWSVAHQPAERPRRRERQKGAPMRVGYLSSSFHDSDLAQLFAPILASHITNGLEVYCYTDNQRRDLTTERLMSMATRWTNLVGVDDATAAQIFHGDRLDVAVDLTGHAPGNRLIALSNCTVPVTISWLGYPQPCGLDHFIAAQTICPTRKDESGTPNAFAYLPDPIVPYEPPSTIPAINDAPVLKNGYITFGMVGDLTQIGHRAVAAWRPVFASEPSSRLSINNSNNLDQACVERCYDAFADFGLRDRVDIVDSASNFETPFEFFHNIDIALTPHGRPVAAVKVPRPIP